MIKTALCALLPLFGAAVYLNVASQPPATPQQAASPASAPTPTGENFARWRDSIRPKPEESRWQQIPWRSSLWEAAVEAQQQDRPIVLWAMNGHPLACT